MTYIVDSFLVVVLGGLQSIIGSLFSSLIISESSTVLAGYMTEISAKLIVFMAIIVIIRFKPQGLFFNKNKR